MKYKKAIVTTAAMLSFGFLNQVFPQSSMGAPVYFDGILAVVEDQVITISQVMQETAFIEMELARRLPLREYHEQVHDLRAQTLDRLIENKLVYTEFKERGYRIPESHITEQINQLIRQQAGGDRVEFELMLREEGLRPDDLRRQLEFRMAVERLLEEEVRRYGSVTEAEIKRFYEQNQRQFLVPEKIKAKLIFIGSRDRSSREFQQIVSEVETRLQRGDDFNLLGLEVSDDRRFLEWSWLPVDQLPPRIGAMAYRLPLEKVSPPVSTSEGVYFVYIKEKEGRRAQDLAAVRDTIQDVLSRHRQEQRYNDFIASLRRKFQVRIYE